MLVLDGTHSLRMFANQYDEWPDIGSMSDWINGDLLVAKPVLNGTHICVCLPFNKMS
jgi:hypothetical protein